MLGGLVGSAVFIGCALGYLLVGARGDLLIFAWWTSGLAVPGFVVAACTVEDDGIERPRYLGSLLSGLRSEWSHSERRS